MNIVAARTADATTARKGVVAVRPVAAMSSQSSQSSQQSSQRDGFRSVMDKVFVG